MAKKKKKKKKSAVVVTVVFVLLALAGLGVMLYPTISDMLARLEMRNMLSKYQEVLEGKGVSNDALWEAAEEYNRYLASKEDQFKLEPGELDRIHGLLNPMGNNMMGSVSIPKIHIELPIYQGIEEKQLQSGAGWYYGSSLPTGGESTHCIITAHNGLVKAKLFTDIDKLEIGDEFYFKILDRKMTYRVDRISVVEPADFSSMLIVPGEDYVTLYTCTPYGVNTHRLLVRGCRVTETDVPIIIPDDVPEETLDDWYMFISLLMQLPLLALLILISIFRSIKKAVKKAKRKRRKRKKQQKAEKAKETADSSAP